MSRCFASDYDTGCEDEEGHGTHVAGIIGAQANYGFSNRGATTVDVFAPGMTILSCYPTSMCANGTHDTIDSTHYSNGYHYMTGTSMASPYVAGVAALMLSVNPNLTPLEIKQKILVGADKNLYIQSDGIDYFKDACGCDGRLNAYNALSIASTQTYLYFELFAIM